MKHLLLTTIATVLLPTTAFAGPIHDAAENGDLAGVQAELDKGANVNRRYGGMTPLHFAADGGHKEIAELLITKGVDVNAKNEWGGTPLHYAAYWGSKEIAELLLAEGADVNAKGKDGWTPLHKAAYYGHKEIVGLLLTKGADVNAKGEGGLNQGKTPLDWAIDFKHTEIAALLRKHGGNTGEELEAAKKSIPVAARYGNIEAIKQHLAAGTDVNAKDKYGRTPLDVANNKETADLLRKHGGNTGVELALFYAAEKGDLAGVQTQLDAGADVNVKDAAGGTPLYSAAYDGHKEVVKLLIANGADVNVKNKFDDTPLDWAVMLGKPEIIDLLRKHGGKTVEELKALMPRLEYGKDKLVIKGRVGLKFEVLYSSDLKEWYVLDTVTLEASSQVYVDEPSPCCAPALIRFYRVKLAE
jgi:cytohesin